MRRPVTTTALSVLAGVAFANPALAAGHEAGEMKSEVPSFEAADKDGNGEISIQEAKAAGVPKSEAKSADFDDDGNLSESDWRFVDTKMKDRES